MTMAIRSSTNMSAESNTTAEITTRSMRRCKRSPSSSCCYHPASLPTMVVSLVASVGCFVLLLFSSSVPGVSSFQQQQQQPGTTLQPRRQTVLMPSSFTRLSSSNSNNKNNQNRLLVSSKIPTLSPPSVVNRQERRGGRGLAASSSNDNNEDSPTSPSTTTTTITTTNNNTIWRPQLRQIMAGIASLGLVETGYLTFAKVVMKTAPYCGATSQSGSGSSCSDVLTGPYSVIPATNIPLSALGFTAYLTVVILSLSPLVFSNNNNNNDDEDSLNRVLLTCTSTMMGTFSIFLMVILFGVLHQSCPYCIFSAGCSITLAQLAWIGGCLPDEEESDESKKTEDETTGAATSSSSTMDWGGQAAAVSFLLSTVGSVVFFLSVNLDEVATNTAYMASSSSSSSSSSLTLLASAGGNTNTEKQQVFSPPPITTVSSDRAIKLADRLQTLDATMYGAYWCSHCYDQKQVFGRQAFSKLTYVECSKDGINSQTKVCKTKDVPGYPTWEISGKLYPGQQELEELEELVDTLSKGD